MKVFIFATAIVAALAAVKQCDMATRPTACIEIYGPVCGTKNDGTTATYDNYCLACADSNVVSYSEGSGCQGEVVTPPPAVAERGIVRPKTPTYTYCQNPRPQFCTYDYRPVCGIKSTGEPQTYGNGCGACSDSSVIAWVPGECASVVTSCAGNVIDCSLILLAYTPSCGFQPGVPFVPTGTTVCCIGSAITQYLPYDCPKPPSGTPSSKTFTSCPAGPRPRFCNRLYKPVCGVHKTGLPQEYSNSCAACADETVAGYLDGKCADFVNTCPV